MDAPLTDHLEFLSDICQWSRGRREIFLETISETLIEFIVEGIYNVLKAFCPTNIHTKKKVEKHKEELEKFTDPRTSFASKKKILTSAETGEAIFFIIKSSVVPFLTDYIKKWCIYFIIPPRIQGLDLKHSPTGIVPLCSI